MSHNVETMAYVGSEGTPWHGLGNPVRRDMSVDEMKVASGLNWPVKLGEMQFKTKAGWLPLPDRIMYRGDTGAILSQVGPQYVPTQNEEVLNFFREYVEAGEMMLDTAGSLQKGRIVWALAKMNAEFMAGPGFGVDDAVRGYVLISNPHQYGMGMTVKFTPIRVVCNNTLTMALSGGGEGLRLWHNRPFDAEAQADAKKKLGIARERMDAFQADVQTLVATTLTSEDVSEVLELVFPEKEKLHEKIIHLYEVAGKGSQLVTSKGTAWGLLNATTEYYDWHAGKTGDTRIRNSWYGANGTAKRQMMNALLERAPEKDELLAVAGD